MKNKNESRRSFLKGSLLLGGVGIFGPSQALAQVIADDSGIKILTGPYLQTNFQDDMHIQWISNKEAHGWVEYGMEPTNLDRIAYGESKAGLRPVGCIHRIVLKDLQPGATYYYRIVCKEIQDFQPYKLSYGAEVRSPIESFIALENRKDEVSFVMLNDIHDRPHSIGYLLDLDKDKQRDFVFFNGDIFDYQTDQQQLIDHFFNPIVDSFAKNTPFLYARGNHETRGKFARTFADYFSEVGYQAFTYGPVRFVVLDSGEDKKDSHPVYGGIVDYDGYREQQARLLEREITSPAFKEAAFRVVLVHIPPVATDPQWHGSNHAASLFQPLLNKGKVDLVLSGHIHQCKFFGPTSGANNYPIVTGGGPKDGSRTLIKLHADMKQIKVEMIGDLGQKIDELFVYRK
ncbi:FN3 domain-containing metallophosphoesterase family protein [Sphingobacterium paucimobilis]|uniref:Calcineurin-like phosphoesterase domain-containing protein n=1 Tax=Sphingobacterium paucimobilis HER1398 TaxID=1346330 RepID=U2HC80_9SPHI|nr:FN3 domain-containing metallophosphoesterase family protein [Sphingobacterium paucimobilis]ERJ59361.1 hypothetical protein M472_11310 [Sphingobacterium paucimobilis HER1398]